jgi:hypothetical protein
MVLTYKNFKDIVFPCWEMPDGEISEKDGLVFLNGKILDDLNMPTPRMGLRRAMSPQNKKNFINLKYSAPSVLTLIKNKGNKRYVDSAGKIFIYRKSKFCKLNYLKIKKIERKTKASLVWVNKHNSPFIVPRPPDYKYSWAGVLYLNSKPWILYEYSETKQKSVRRKV